jgi:hypothetical protein
VSATMCSIPAVRKRAVNGNSRILDAAICFLDELFTRGCETLLMRTLFSARRRNGDTTTPAGFIGRPTASGPLAGHLVGSSAHPI